MDATKLEMYAKNYLKIYNLWTTIAWIAGEKKFDGLGTVKLLEHKGGEGQGEEYYIVFSVTDEEGETVIFKKNGYYSSYDGVEWYEDQARLVKPVAITIIEYQDV